MVTNLCVSKSGCLPTYTVDSTAHIKFGIDSSLDLMEIKTNICCIRKKRIWKIDGIISNKKPKIEEEMEKSQIDVKKYALEIEKADKCPRSPAYCENILMHEPKIINLTRTIPLGNKKDINILRKEMLNVKFKVNNKYKVVDRQIITDLLNCYIHSTCSHKHLDDILRQTTDFFSKYPNIIVSVIIEILNKTDEALDYSDQYSKSPRLPLTVKKIILLLQKAEKKVINIISKFVEKFLFCTDSHKREFLICMNLTHLYIGLLSLNCMTDHKSKTRLYIAKCFYFYNDFAYPMVHQLILAFPGVLPYNNDTTYERSDALISLIQCILMNTYYANSDKQHLKMMKLFNLLIYRYKYQPGKPSKNDLILNLISKIKAGKTKNVSLCFAILCRRNEPNWNENMIMKPFLLPLLTEFYKTLHITETNDKRIECLLETISLLIKPISITSDISSYLNIFSQFISLSVNRKCIRDAALCAILRLARFGYMNCYNVIRNLIACKSDMETISKAALKTFLYNNQIKA